MNSFCETSFEIYMNSLCGTERVHSKTACSTNSPLTCNLKKKLTLTLGEVDVVHMSLITSEGS